MDSTMIEKGALEDRHQQCCAALDHRQQPLRDGQIPTILGQKLLLSLHHNDHSRWFVLQPNGQDAAPIIVSFFTPDTPYEQDAARLEMSLLNAGDPTRAILPMHDSGLRETNRSLQPGFILNCLTQLKAPVLWVDANSHFVRFPHLPQGFGFAVDLAVVPQDDGTFAGSLLYFSPTPTTLALVRTWMDLSQQRPLLPPARLLDEAWSTTCAQRPVATAWLPRSAVLEQTAPSGQPLENTPPADAVIIHHHHCGSSHRQPTLPTGFTESRCAGKAQPFHHDLPPILANHGGLRWPRVDCNLGTLMDYVQALKGFRGEAVFFLQVGAMDGVRFDPLYRRVREHLWQGILFEPLPDIFAQLVENYRACDGLTFINAAIDTHSGPRTMFRIPQDTVSSGALPEWALGISSFYNDRNALGGKKISPEIKAIIEAHTAQETVHCVTFEEVLTDHAVEQIDLLQIDTEGHDWHVLKSFPITRIKPTVINFEHYNMPLAERMEALSWLRTHGYAYDMSHKDVTATLLRIPASS